ncbi:MAG TPA: hypothetical protein VMD59_21975, partial [Acidimicrobiales bacterium]|nr:hypothetical protein [Acidimicrobiales bacterium]
GFSYGGMVVTGAVEHLASRIAELVYLDAFLPRDGEALYDLTGQSAAPPPAPPGPTAPPGQPWLVDPPPRTPPSDAAVAAWFAARRTAHPRRCFTEAVHLPRPLESYDFGLTYVKATGAPRPEGGDAFWRAADRVRSSPRWRYREIGSDHTVPTTRPAELAALLLELT